MLDLIVLPFTWLVFFISGILIKNVSFEKRSLTLTLLSNLIIFSYTGFTTWIFFISLCLFTIFGGYLINILKIKSIRKTVLIFYLLFFVILIFSFLQFRFYFNKFFVFLPSLSYFGFRSIDYIMNQYKNKNFSFYAGMLQTSFFPIISMGPITRTDDFSAKIKYDYEKVIQKLMIGLIMLILGEYFGLYVLININETHSALEFWISAVSNSFYIYLVFAGYSNLIIGLGLLVGIKLPENFNSPYLSTSITEFWRKWHISLSFWIRDYLYITLGGNRKGILRKIINIIVAMILCGLWHGISLNFLLWGLYHGILLGIESLMVSYNFFPIKNYFPRIHRIIKTFIVFFLVTISWILFTYNIQDSMIHIKGLFIW